jgi:uncharacterized cupin superfamily protein
MAETAAPARTFIARAADRTADKELSFSHPLNPQRSSVNLHFLGDVVGLQRIGVHQIRVPPGKESFVYHRHHGEEEFLYIISGNGVVEIDGQDHPVGAGDFVGFPVGVAHHLRNDSDQDLVYLSGGLRNPTEIAEFPDHGKLLLRSGRQVSMVDATTAEDFPGAPPLLPRGK